MGQKRGGGHGGGTDKLHILECPDCGCPNRPGDLKCMYCRADLTGPRAAIKVRLYPYISNIREFFHSHRQEASRPGAAKSAWAAVIALLLTVAGTAFLARGYQQGGYANWTLGILLFLYGGAALHAVWAGFKK